MADEVKDPQAQDAPTPPVVEPPVAETPVEEPFDKDRAMATINKLRETEKQAKKDAKELEALKAEKKQRDEAALSETEREKKRADDLATENVKIKSDLIRRDVIAEVGLPASFASRLQGTTKEELLADAQELAKTLPQLKSAPKIPAHNPDNANPSETDAQKRERLFGRQGNIFDLDAIKQQGGGVVWNQK